MWGYLKQHEIGNLCATHLGQVSDFAGRRLKSMQRRPTLVTAFWKQAELAERWWRAFGAESVTSLAWLEEFAGTISC